MSARSSCPWELYAYGFSLVLALVMFAAVILFTSAHCQNVLAATGTPGACGLGIGWILFAIAFLALAAYSAWELARILKAEKKKD